MGDKLTCDDVLKYESHVSKVPAFILGRMAMKNSNLVAKFESQIKPRLENLSEHHKQLIDIVLASDVSDLQSVLDEAFQKTGTKQFKILADSKNARFIERNLEEVRKLL